MGDLEELMEDPEAWRARSRERVWARTLELLFGEDQDRDNENREAEHPLAPEDDDEEVER